SFLKYHTIHGNFAARCEHCSNHRANKIQDPRALNRDENVSCPVVVRQILPASLKSLQSLFSLRSRFKVLIQSFALLTYERLRKKCETQFYKFRMTFENRNTDSCRRLSTSLPPTLCSWT